MEIRERMPVGSSKSHLQEAGSLRTARQNQVDFDIALIAKALQQSVAVD